MHNPSLLPLKPNHQVAGRAFRHALGLLGMGSTARAPEAKKDDGCDIPNWFTVMYIVLIRFWVLKKKYYIYIYI